MNKNTVRHVSVLSKMQRSCFYYKYCSCTIRLLIT